MDAHLMPPEVLLRITGAKRYSKQRQWFRDEFGVDVVCSSHGEVIMTWTAFDALMFRKWGIAVGEPPKPDVQLCYD